MKAGAGIAAAIMVAVLAVPVPAGACPPGCPNPILPCCCPTPCPVFDPARLGEWLRDLALEQAKLESRAAEHAAHDLVARITGSAGPAGSFFALPDLGSLVLPEKPTATVPVPAEEGIDPRQRFQHIRERNRQANLDAYATALAVRRGPGDDAGTLREIVVLAGRATTLREAARVNTAARLLVSSKLFRVITILSERTRTAALPGILASAGRTIQPPTPASSDRSDRPFPPDAIARVMRARMLTLVRDAVTIHNDQVAEAELLGTMDPHQDTIAAHEAALARRNAKATEMRALLDTIFEDPPLANAAIIARLTSLDHTTYAMSDIRHSHARAAAENVGSQVVATPAAFGNPLHSGTRTVTTASGIPVRLPNHLFVLAGRLGIDLPEPAPESDTTPEAITDAFRARVVAALAGHYATFLELHKIERFWLALRRDAEDANDRTRALLVETAGRYGGGSPRASAADARKRDLLAAYRTLAETYPPSLEGRDGAFLAALARTAALIGADPNALTYISLQLPTEGTRP